MEPGPRKARRARIAELERPRRFTTCGATLSQASPVPQGAPRSQPAAPARRTATALPPGSRDDTFPVPRAAAIEIVGGTRLGRYEIVQPLGAGSMGRVFEAADTELGRRVALKLVRARGADRDVARRRLRREAQLMARLTHANVAAVFDLGTAGDHLYLAMELVRGGTLRDFVERTRPWRRELRALALAGRGLAAAHDAGVIHRDVKPDNVLVGAGGAVRLADFGVACAAGEPAEHGPGLAGTPAYIAPEGFDGVADAATDQFAFAVTAFEVLEKRRPFELGGSVESHLEVLRRGRRVPWRRGAVPARVRAAIDRALAFAPADRWPSMRSLCAALERAMG